MILERRLKPNVNVDLTPLIDVVFQLVIFFMITSVFKTTPGIPVDLPGSATAESTAVSEIRVIIRSESEIWVGQDQTDIRGLEALVAKALEGAHGNDTVATVEGDSGASYALMVAALDALRANGIDSVGLVARREAAGAAGASSP
ncbi:MAG TPA: biopolymer transporter ExbD [Spirochaetales bacterium]|nr:biopolymer transporter ExbD [Spirochaetales bacterium]